MAKVSLRSAIRRSQRISLTGDAPAKALSCYSILYLFALFAAPAIDRMAG
jgi:hypothetical protein